MFNTTLCTLPRVDIYPPPLSKKPMRYVIKQTWVGERYCIRTVYSFEKTKIFLQQVRKTC